MLSTHVPCAFATHMYFIRLYWYDIATYIRSDIFHAYNAAI